METSNIATNESYIRQLLNQYALSSAQDYPKASQSLAEGLIDIDLKNNPHNVKDKYEQQDCFYRLFNIITEHFEIRNESIQFLLEALSAILLGSKSKFRKDRYDSFDEKAELLSNHIPYLISEVQSLWETVSLDDMQFRLASIMLFSATNSGLCNVPSMEALLYKLQTEEQCLNFIEKHFFFKLRFQDRRHETNTVAENSEVLETLRFWYPDSLSLATIIGLKKMKKQTGKPVYGLSDLVKYIFKQVKLQHDVRLPSPVLFLKACALYFYRASSGAPNISLKNYANGSYSSASMSVKSLYAVNDIRVINETDSFDFKNASKELVKKNKKKIKLFEKYNGEFSNEAFFADLCSACAEKDKHGHIRSQKEARRELAQVSVKYESMPPAAEILLDWISTKLESKDWRNVSATRNLHAIGKVWLAKVGKDQLEEADGADMQVLFELIGEERFKEDRDSRNALIRLLTHAHVKFQIALPDEFEGGPLAVTHVRSEVVSEQSYQRLRDDMQTIYAESSLLIRHGIDVIIILANRLFMRPSEILRIRLKDIEVSNMSWITIRPSIWSILKTANARRMIPTSLLLLPEEFDIFVRFIKMRRHQTIERPKALLFSQVIDADIPLPLTAIGTNIGKLLKSYQGEPTRFYSLRHTGISNLQLVLLGSERLQTKYLAYDQKRIAQMKLFLACNESDKYFQVAALAGHLSPETTLSTYAHFTDLLLYEASMNNRYNLTFNVWRKILRIRPSKLVKAIGDETADNKIIMTPVGLITEQAKGLCSTLKNSKQVRYKPKPVVIISFQQNIESIDQILKLYDEHGSAAEVAWRLEYDEQWIEAVIEVAKKIKVHYKTTRGKPRLYPSEFSGVCPIKPASNIEKLDADRIIRLLESDKALCKDLKLSIHHAFDTISQDHPEISFKDPALLNTFISQFKGIIAPNRWHVSLVPLTDNVDKCISVWSKVSLGNIRVCPDRKKNKKLFPHGQLSLQYLRKDSHKVIGTFKTPIKFNKYGSNALKWVMHVVAIYIGAEKLINNTSK
ncbi:hypothetical protein [Glaciecola sp. SC05]|uniref:hypothetical protein n=1 Tax=Glaciecola sp. SC05 TaxID=1987355 RepID=UPI003529B4AF